MHLKTTSWIILFLTLSYVPMLAQRQLIILSGSEVVHRFKVGDTFQIKCAGNRTKHQGFLVDINEFAFTINQDTIDLRDARKILLPFRSFGQKTGSKLAQAGVLLFVADQVNNSWIQGNDFRVDPGVSKVATVFFVVGITMMLKKNWAKVKRRVRVLSVDSNSRFYQSDL